MLQDKYDTARGLYEKKYGPKPPMLDAAQQLAEHRAARKGEDGTAQQIAAQILSLEAKQASSDAAYLSDALDRRAKAQDKMSGLDGDIRKARQHAANRRLVAPVDGTVQNVKVHTPGAVVTTVVTAGDVLMSVVPDGTGIEIDAGVENRDIGFVRDGQPVEVKVDALPFTRYGLLSGVLRHVGRDAATQGGAHDVASVPGGGGGVSSTYIGHNIMINSFGGAVVVTSVVSLLMVINSGNEGTRTMPLQQDSGNIKVHLLENYGSDLEAKKDYAIELDVPVNLMLRANPTSGYMDSLLLGIPLSMLSKSAICGSTEDEGCSDSSRGFLVSLENKTHWFFKPTVANEFSSMADVYFDIEMRSFRSKLNYNSNLVLTDDLARKNYGYDEKFFLENKLEDQSMKVEAIYAKKADDSKHYRFILYCEDISRQDAHNCQLHFSATCSPATGVEVTGISPRRIGSSAYLYDKVNEIVASMFVKDSQKRSK